MAGVTAEAQVGENQTLQSSISLQIAINQKFAALFAPVIRLRMEKLFMFQGVIQTHQSLEDCCAAAFWFDLKFYPRL